MTAPASSLKAVQTYQKSGLGFLQNLCCGIATANTKFKDFQDMTGQLGNTVTFDRPVRHVRNNSLVADFKGVTQLSQTLTVDKASSVAFSFTNQDYVFNAEKYIEEFNQSAVQEIGAGIESDLFGQVAINNTYRTYYSGITSNAIDPINSFTQLATSLAHYRNFGSPNGGVKYYLPDVAVPQIVGSGLNQFAINRNNEMANSWDLGNFSNANFYQSNLLPLHTAGTIGDDGETMTVVSINAAGNQLTLNGVTASTATLKEGDVIEFNDGVSGHPNMRFLTYVGHLPSDQKVQVRLTADATADGSGQIVADIFPALVSDATNSAQNINNAVAAGMQLKCLPSHRAGFVVGGNAMYLAMPQLPDEEPYATARDADPETGVALRVYKGTKFGENERGFVCDAIYGYTMVDDYAMRVAFPV